MKILLAAICLTQTAICQPTALTDFNIQQRKINKNGFVVLGSWATANIIYNSIATNGATGSNKYFKQMNIMWNAANLGLSIMGYFKAGSAEAISYSKSLKQQQTLEKTFLFNAGLDISYIAAGLYLRERSNSVIKNSAKYKGYGESVIFQGGGLLLFDAIMYTLHSRNGKKLARLAEKVQLTTTGSGIGMLVTL